MAVSRMCSGSQHLIHTLATTLIWSSLRLAAHADSKATAPMGLKELLRQQAIRRLNP